MVDKAIAELREVARQFRRAMALAREKLSLIHIAKSRLGMSDPEYRDILMHYGGVTSSRDLDQTGFELVMEAFHRCGRLPISATIGPATRTAKATTRASVNGSTTERSHIPLMLLSSFRIGPKSVSRLLRSH